MGRPALEGRSVKRSKAFDDITIKQGDNIQLAYGCQRTASEADFIVTGEMVDYENGEFVFTVRGKYVRT